MRTLSAGHQRESRVMVLERRATVMAVPLPWWWDQLIATVSVHTAKGCRPGSKVRPTLVRVTGQTLGAL